MRRQDIVKKRDFPSKISRHCYERLVPKIVVWHDQREMFVKMTLHDRLDCLVDFAGMIFFFLLPLPKCFFRVCFPTLFAADLIDFLPLINSPISDAANSNMSATIRFAAGLERKIYAEMELKFCQYLVREPEIPFPSVFQPLYSLQFLFVLKQPSCSTVCVKNDCWTPS